MELPSDTPRLAAELPERVLQHGADEHRHRLFQALLKKSVRLGEAVPRRLVASVREGGEELLTVFRFPEAQ